MSKFGGGVTRFQIVLQRYSAGYELNDLGWLQRADEIMFRNWFALQYQHPNELLAAGVLQLQLRGATGRRTGCPTREGLNTNWHVQLPEPVVAATGASPSAISRDAATTIAPRAGARRSAATPSCDVWGGLRGRLAQAVTPFVFADRGGTTRGGAVGGGVEPSSITASRRASRRRCSFNYGGNVEDDQFYESYGAAGSDTTHYTFARLDQTTVERDGSHQLHGDAEPVVPVLRAALHFERNVRQPARAHDPRSVSLRGSLRAVPRDCEGAATARTAILDGFDYKQFHTNAVVRCEYRPGAAIFVVWQQGRFHDTGRPSDFQGMQDYEDLFALHPNNTFLIRRRTGSITNGRDVRGQTSEFRIQKRSRILNSEI